ncbi:MAG: F0F1 ATP synthase subunit gamma [Candidatus Eisenbacteria bacterium]|jgi:F-type H+-transporting ATPase subunit gamma|nr:F0F1 ATP synthase subunit gamma [Candidatus Eisenbacteria bacterium]
MAAIREIRHHVRAVHSLRQMTHALTQVASARARKCRIQLREVAPYARGLERAMSLLTLRHGLQHPLLWRRPVQRDVAVVVGSERGFCGTHNLEVVRVVTALQGPEPGVQRDFLAVGSKLAEVMKTHGIVPATMMTRPRWGYPAEIAPLADDLTAGYLNGGYQRVIIVGFAREDSGRKAVTIRVLLPAHPASEPALSRLSPEIEPGSTELMDHVIPRLIRSQLRMAILHSMVFEEEARALAMQSATANADDLLVELMRRYRRARQDRITRELLEVVATTDAGAAA